MRVYKKCINNKKIENGRYDYMDCPIGVFLSNVCLAADYLKKHWLNWNCLTM